MEIIDLMKIKQDIEHDEFYKWMANILASEVEAMGFLIDRWQERIKEIELWISLGKEFSDPTYCISLLNNLTDEQIMAFSNAIRETAKEFQESSQT